MGVQGGLCTCATLLGERSSNSMWHWRAIKVKFLAQKRASTEL